MSTGVTSRSMVVCIMISLLLTGLCGKLQAEITLARTGKSDYTIVIDRDCSPSERHGAEELQRFLAQICGAKLRISLEDVHGPKILIGASKALDRLPVKIDFKALGDEGFVIKTVDPHLVLAGGRVRGTMYACYEFLHKYLGCRWFTPKVSRITHRETVTLPAIDYRKIPALEYRDIYYQEACDGDWSARNHVTGMNSRLGAQHGGKFGYHNEHFCHTLIHAVPPEKYFQEHPEYFAELGGKRHGRRGHYDQLCLTNPDVVKIVTESVRQWLRDEPECDIVSVSEGDLSSFCECRKCLALVEREGSQSGPILHFVNQIADNIKEEFPNKAVSTLAYSHKGTRKPPKHVKPRPNVVVRFVSAGCCVFHPLATGDFEGNRYSREDIAAWSKMCDRIHVWDYVADYGDYLMPRPNFHVLQPNIKFFVDHGLKGIFEQGICSQAGGEFAELRSYILARSLWDPQCDWRKVMDEFLDAYYGAAAKPIRRYIDMLQQKVVDDNIHSHAPMGARRGEFLTRDVITRADTLFDKAEAAAAGDPVLLRRVEKERLGIRLVKIRRHAEFLPSWQEHEAAVEEFARIAKECSISYFAEGNRRPLDGELKKWREEIAFHKTADEMTLLPLGPSWKFAADRNDIGVSEKWFADSFKDNQWAVMYSDRGSGWKSQGFPGHTGFGWYRQAFDVPAELEQPQFVYLYFGAVDEDAYVYLNGELVHEHSCKSTGLDPKDIWVRPFAFDVKRHLKFGRQNAMAVRVHNRGGMGGIYKPVFLIGADREVDAYAMRAVLEERGKLKARLVAHWKLEEGAGTRAADCVGSNNGTIHGASWSTDTPGPGSSHSLELDGIDDYVDLRQGTPEPRLESWIHPKKSFTVELWAKSPSDKGLQAAFYCGRPDRAQPFGIVVLPEADLISVESIGTVNYAVGRYVKDRWYHVVAVYKRDNQGADLYLNGVKRTTTSHTADFRAFQDRWASLLGAGSTWNNDANQPVRNLFFKGKIDEFRLYDGALSPEEIERSYNRMLKPAAALPPTG